MFRRFSLSLLVAAAPTFALADPQEVRASWDQFFTEFTAADAEGIADLFAPDASFYGTSLQDPVDREGVRQYFAEPFEGREPGSIPASIVGEPIITMVTDDVATVTGKWKNEGMREGKMETRTYRVTAVLADRGEGWQIVQFHNSPLPE